MKPLFGLRRHDAGANSAADPQGEPRKRRVIGAWGLGGRVFLHYPVRFLRRGNCVPQIPRCAPEPRIANPPFQPATGFSLVELLVALVVFAALAAAAYGGLASIARVRSALATQQDRFAAVTRSVSELERDLRQAVSRSVRDNEGAVQPALIGGSDSVELSRLGFANPLAEPRSNLQRVVYALDDNKLQRGRYAVLDRAPNSAPATTTLLTHISDFHLRYFGCDGIWRDAWPPSEPACASGLATTDMLPRAVEFRLVLPDLGEIRRIVELPSSLPGVDDSTPPPPRSPPGDRP